MRAICICICNGLNLGARNVRCAQNPFTLSGPAMYICICNGITERQIIQAAEHGARSGEDLERGLGVASPAVAAASARASC